MQPGPGDESARVPTQTPKVVGTGTLDNSRWFEIYRGNMLLGTTNLEVIVEPGARAAGLFHPTPAFASARPVFALYRQALERNSDQMLREYVRRRDLLSLRVLRGGLLLNAQVDLISSWTAAIHIVHVTCRDPRMWN